MIFSQFLKLFKFLNEDYVLYLFISGTLYLLYFCFHGSFFKKYPYTTIKLKMVVNVSDIMHGRPNDFIKDKSMYKIIIKLVDFILLLVG
jgi:hypothetical protein